MNVLQTYVRHTRIIAGQEVSLFGLRVRGPLTLLARDPADVRRYQNQVNIVAHKANNGFWFERVFKSRRQAIDFISALAEAFNGITVAEYMQRRDGR